MAPAPAWWKLLTKSANPAAHVVMHVQAIVLTVAAFRRAKGIPLRMRPLFISKVNTFVQVGLIIAILAHLAQVVTFTDPDRQALVLPAALTTTVSWIPFLIEVVRAFGPLHPAPRAMVYTLRY